MLTSLEDVVAWQVEAVAGGLAAALLRYTLRSLL